MDSVNTFTGAEGAAATHITYSLVHELAWQKFDIMARPPEHQTAFEAAPAAEAAEQTVDEQPEPVPETALQEPTPPPVSREAVPAAWLWPSQSVPEPEASPELKAARQHRASLVKHLIEASDESSRLKGPDLQRRIGQSLGLRAREGMTAFQVLRQMGILRVEYRDPAGEAPDVFAVHQQAIRTAIRRGYLPPAVGLVLDEYPRPEPVAETPPAEARPAGTGRTLSGFPMSARTRRALENEQRRHPAAAPRAAAEEHLNDPSQLPADEVAGRYRKSALLAEAVTDYTVTPAEVDILTHAEFVALALTAPALQREFASHQEFGAAIIETTGFQGRALSTIFAFLLKHKYIERHETRASGLRLTSQGAQFLQNGLAVARQ